MAPTGEDLLAARHLARRAVTLVMIGADSEAAVASLADLAADSVSDLQRARTMLDFGTGPDVSACRRRAENLLDAAAERRGTTNLVAA